MWEGLLDGANNDSGRNNPGWSFQHSQLAGCGCKDDALASWWAFVDGAFNCPSWSGCCWSWWLRWRPLVPRFPRDDSLVDLWRLRLSDVRRVMVGGVLFCFTSVVDSFGSLEQRVWGEFVTLVDFSPNCLGLSWLIRLVGLGGLGNYFRRWCNVQFLLMMIL